MDWRVLLTTFGVIFLAPVGRQNPVGGDDPDGADQKALGSAHRGVAGFGVRHRDRYCGRRSARPLHLRWTSVKPVAAIAFFVIGVLMLAGKLRKVARASSVYGLSHFINQARAAWRAAGVTTWPVCVWISSSNLSAACAWR